MSGERGREDAVCGGGQVKSCVVSRGGGVITLSFCLNFNQIQNFENRSRSQPPPPSRHLNNERSIRGWFSYC